MEFNNLNEVANKLIDNNKKINLLYAFNGVGKTRLSLEFINSINSNEDDSVLYFNSFIEDLFSWNNIVEHSSGGFGETSSSLFLDINSNFFNILKESGKDHEVISLFKYYSNSKIEPYINFETGEITFNLPTGYDETISCIKISRGEESLFMWSIFYVLVEEIIEKYNSFEDGEIDFIETSIKYIFIDDPVSSLDDNHLINVAIDLSKLLKKSTSKDLRFFITTHHPLFFNVLHNEWKSANRCLYKKENEKYILEKTGDSPFSYHLEIKRIIEKAIEEDNVQKFHFNLLRNLLEKTANFLGYKTWSCCVVEKNREAYARIINVYSHSSYSTEESNELKIEEKSMFKHVFERFIEDFKWYKEDNNES